MSSVKLQLKTSQELKDGSHPIIIQVLKDNKKSITTLGVSCLLLEWNEGLNLPRNRRLSLICQKKLIEIEELLFEGIDKNWSSKKIVNIFTGKDTKQLMFINYAENVQIETKQGVSTNNTDFYFRNKFKKYLNNQDITFSNISFNFLKEYKESLNNEGIKTAFRYLYYLRQVYDLAVESDNYVPRKYPFKKSLFIRKLSEPTQNKNLTLDQVKHIFNIDVRALDTEYKKQCVDFWKFCFLMRGINFIDLAVIKTKNIKGDYYVFTREKLKSKTQRTQKVKIFKESREIIDKYYDKSNEYLFPILSNGQNKDLSKEDYKRYKYKHSTINRNLKKIGEDLETPFALTSVSARYSFVNMAKKQEIPFLFLQELIGHKTLTTTDVYLDVFPQSKIDDHHRGVLDLVLSNKKTSY